MSEIDRILRRPKRFTRNHEIGGNFGDQSSRRLDCVWETVEVRRLSRRKIDRIVFL